MATPLQLAANRANSLLSTGPRTPEDRATSALNHQSHGLTTRQALLPTEDPEEYAGHHQAYAERYHPQFHISRELVTELADLRWRLRRVPHFEADLIQAEVIKLTTEPEFEPLLKNLQSDGQVVSLAFARLIDSRVLTNLFNQESRLSRRADKIQDRLDAALHRRPLPPPEERPSIAELLESVKPQPHSQNQKIEPIRVPPQPGRNQTCPCRSGLKFKHCCLNKPLSHPATA